MNADFDALFQRCVAEHGRFGHPAHLHLAWLLLEEHSALEALAIFNAGLKALAARTNLTDKYNATLTTAFFFLVLERREPGQTWQMFAARHADLLDWQQRASFLSALYDLDSLSSAAARQGFVMPGAPVQNQVKGRWVGERTVAGRDTARLTWGAHNIFMISGELRRAGIE